MTKKENDGILDGTMRINRGLSPKRYMSYMWFWGIAEESGGNHG
jgi:hypothetical protein